MSRLVRRLVQPRPSPRWRTGSWGTAYSGSPILNTGTTPVAGDGRGSPTTRELCRDGARTTGTARFRGAVGGPVAASHSDLWPRAVTDGCSGMAMASNACAGHQMPTLGEPDPPAPLPSASGGEAASPVGPAALDTERPTPNFPRRGGWSFFRIRLRGATRRGIHDLSLRRSADGSSSRRGDCVR
mgnify:CR=1 FL=1